LPGGTEEKLQNLRLVGIPAEIQKGNPGIQVRSVADFCHVVGIGSCGHSAGCARFAVLTAVTGWLLFLWLSHSSLQLLGAPKTLVGFQIFVIYVYIYIYFFFSSNILFYLNVDSTLSVYEEPKFISAFGPRKVLNRPWNEAV
jgi:hypothetical protein